MVTIPTSVWSVVPAPPTLMPVMVLPLITEPTKVVPELLIPVVVEAVAPAKVPVVIKLLTVLFVNESVVPPTPALDVQERPVLVPVFNERAIPVIVLPFTVTVVTRPLTLIPANVPVPVRVIPTVLPETVCV